MIDGYESVITLSSAMAAVFYVWLVPAVASIFVALIGFGTGRDVDEMARFSDLLRTVQAAQGALGLFTAAMFVYWVFRARENVRRLGKRHKIGVGKIFFKHISALGLVLVAIVLIAFVPSAALFGVLLLISAVVWMSLMFNMMAMASLRMLWRTSSPPTGLEEGLPHLAVIWLVSWILSGWTAGTLQPQQASYTLQPSTAAVFLVLHALSLAVAAVAIARLVVQVAARQDERLGVLISHVDGDGLDDEGPAVTSDQIQHAWEESNNLVDFNH